MFEAFPRKLPFATAREIRGVEMQRCKMVAAQMHNVAYSRPKEISSSLRRPSYFEPKMMLRAELSQLVHAQSEYRLPLFLLLQCPSERAAEEGFANMPIVVAVFSQGECR